MAVKYFKFVISRLIGTGVDTLVLWILSVYVFYTYAGIYLLAPTISFQIAMFGNFLMSYYWIWNKRIFQKNPRLFFIRLGLFNLSSVVGFGIKMIFLLLFERLFRWDVIYCNLVALLISGTVNYLLADMLVFRKPVLRQVVDSHLHFPEQEIHTTPAQHNKAIYQKQVP
jgi:putative flippase GtrA